MSVEFRKVPEIRFPEFDGKWEERKLKDVLNLTPRTFKMKDAGEYFLVTVKRRFGGVVSRGKYFGRDIKVKSQFIIKANDFLISKRQISHKAFGIVPKELDGSIVSNEYSVFIPRDNLDINYLNHFCRRPSVSYTFFLSSIGVHIEKMLFHVEDWLKRKFYFPSLFEQQKITSFLSDIDAKIEKLSRKKELLEQYKKGIMQKLFSREIRFKDENGEEFPEWEEKKLGDIGAFYRGHSYNASNVKQEGLLVLRSSNIKDYILNLNEDLQFVNIDCKEDIELIKNDMVICMANGSKKLVGKSAEYLGAYSGTVTVGAFCSIFRSKNILSKYIFQTEQYRSYLHIILAGTNINNLKNSEIEKLNFVLPVSNKEQKNIADFLRNFDSKISQLDKEISAVKEFKKGLLQVMFVQINCRGY